MADNTISVEALELSVKTSSGTAASSVAELVTALGKLKGKYKSLNTIANSMNTLRNATKGGLGLTSATTQIEKFGNAVAHSINQSRINKINDLAKSIRSLKRASSSFRMPSLSAINRMPAAKNALEKQEETEAERDERIRKMVEDSYKRTSYDASKVIEPPDYRKDTVDGMTGATEEEKAYAEFIEQVCERNREAAETAKEAGKASAKATEEAKAEMLSYAEATSMTTREILMQKKVMAGDVVHAGIQSGDEKLMWKGIAAYNAAERAINKYDAAQAKAAQDAEYSRIREANALAFINERYNTLPASIQRIIDEERAAGTSNDELKKRFWNLDEELKRKPKDTQKAASGFKSLGKVLKSGKSAVGDYIKNHTKLIRQFGRVAKMRAMRWAIRAITQSIKEGIGNLYEYSKAMKTPFAGKMDTAASALLTLKNSIATAVAPLIEMLLPTLQKVVSWIREAANWLAQVFAQLNGQSTWTRAKDAVTQYSDATKDAKDNTKEMLAAFDELNVISSETNSGSGKTTADYKSMFEEVSTFDKSSTQWAERLKKIFNAIKSIWEKIKPIVQKVFSAITGWISDNWPTIEKIFNWIGDHFGEVLTTVLAIKAGLGLWKLASNLIPGLTNAKGLLGDISGLCSALGAIGTIGITIAIIRQIQDVISNETTDAMKEYTDVSDNEKQQKKTTSAIELGFGTLLGLAGKHPLLAAANVANGLVGLTTGINPLDMILQVGKYILTEDPLAGFRNGEGNAFARYYASLFGSEKTNKTLNGLGIPTMSALPAVGTPKFVKELEASLKRCHKILEKAGVDANDILDNWDLFAPLVQSEGVEESTKRILSLIDTYGSDWLKHLDMIGVDTRTMLKAQSREYTRLGKALPASLAEGIASSSVYKDSLKGVLITTKLTLKEISSIVNNTNLTMPMVQRYGYEQSLQIIEQVAKIAGHDTEEIIWGWDLIAPTVERLGLEKSITAIVNLATSAGKSVAWIIDNWNLIAPYIDDNNFEKSLTDIAKLIKKYGADWQNHLDELKLTAKVDVKEKDGAIKGFISKVQDAIKNKFTAYIDDLKANLNVNYNYSGTGAGQTFSNGYGSNGYTNTSGNNSTNYDNSATIQPSVAGFTGMSTQNTTGSNALDAFLGIGGKTIADVLAQLPYDYPKIFTKPLDKVLQYKKGKENSKTIEVWNLTAAEVGLLTDLGYKIKKNWGKTSKGIRQIKQFAAGGIGIPNGDLFLANETGVPEMIGRIGNQNAVVNNAQIISGIAQGMASVMAGVERRLERIEQYTGVVADKDFSVKITPSVGLGRVNAQSAALYSGVTGR